ncbi:MAG: UDP-3-O-(3-hydroxymyristoyl)glucosamine N-acyltransferase [Deltaproteobacteria bacterium RBG_13_60_28]|nr:MAG: UDP-3-O-(3-hydroxymyristoyl)glucosamine N-acyltransferase [Deltaproteobacteria bacterium RBG_13_60_28]
MERTLGELAVLLGGKLQGPADLVIQGIASIELATPRDITFITQKRYARLAAQSRAAAFIVGQDQAHLPRPAIIVPHPYLAYAQAAGLFAPPLKRWPGVSPLAFLGQEVEMGQEVSIAPLVCISDGVRLGDRVTIMPGCVLGDQVQIGADTLLYPNVTILERCTLGQRVIIHSGTVIGSDGFGFVPGKEGHRKIPQLGTVVIEDDVEIGANCTIDRGALGETRVGRGVKMDNLVHLAHNVTVGEHSLLVAQVGVAGSTKLGKGVALGGQVGLGGHIELGDGVQVGAQSGVPHSVPPGQTVTGSPARPHQEWMRIMGHLPKLPEIYRRLKELEKRLTELAAKPPEEHQE